VKLSFSKTGDGTVILKQCQVLLDGVLGDIVVKLNSILTNPLLSPKQHKETANAGRILKDLAPLIDQGVFIWISSNVYADIRTTRENSLVDDD
jgi:hypothetical protein